jgi:hypothetical protein
MKFQYEYDNEMKIKTERGECQIATEINIFILTFSSGMNEMKGDENA